MATQECENCNDSQCSAQHKNPRESQQDFIERKQMQSRLCKIDNKILVLSGKGGVGKSTVAVNLAMSLALAGKRVGLLDVDIHGPSVPKLLHIEDAHITGSDNALDPVKVVAGSGMIHVMSIGFLLRERDDAVIWRGPRKYGVIKQFLKDVEWGELDYLVVDSPPGTGDEPLAIAQLLDQIQGAVIVTTPQQVAVQDVRRCIMFCRDLNVPVIGVVENMSGYTCPKCNETIPIFGADGGKNMATEMGVGFLGAIPIEPSMVISGDDGEPIVRDKPHSVAAKVFARIARILLEPEMKEIDGEDSDEQRTA